MAEKTAKLRIKQKHDTEANWKKATNFRPEAGELIVYDADNTHSAPRFKVGDGTKLVNALPFVGTDEVLIGTSLPIADETRKFFIKTDENYTGGSSSGGSSLPSGGTSTDGLWGNSVWATPVSINDNTFRSQAGKTIYAPITKSGFKGATSSDTFPYYYAPAKAKSYCVFQKGGTTPIWTDTFSTDDYIETVTVTTSMPTNATAKSYTIARDLRWCRLVIFAVGHKNGYWISTAFNRQMLLSGNYFSIDDSSNGFQLSTSNMRSTSSGGHTTVTVKSSSYNNLTAGLRAYLIY